VTASLVLSDTDLEQRLVGACVHNGELLRLIGERIPNEGIGFIRTAPELRAILGVLFIWHDRGEYDNRTNEGRLIELLARVDRQDRDGRWWADYLEGIWCGETMANLPYCEALLAELQAKYGRHDAFEHSYLDLNEHGEVDDWLSDAMYQRLGQAIARRKNKEKARTPPPPVRRIHPGRKWGGVS
jgi:hypothetical protein